MAVREQAKARAGAAATLIIAALVVAACGSSSASSSGAYGPAASSSTASSGSVTTTVAVSASGVKISTAHGSAGTYLVGPTGRALYLWAADTNGSSSCSGQCAKTWAPLTTTASPQAGGGAMSADLNTIKRSDGSTQVMYKGHPLYYFVGDTGPGMTKGQGSNSFGAKWWLLAPNGSPITGGGTSSGSSGGTTSSGSSGSGGWG